MIGSRGGHCADPVAAPPSARDGGGAVTTDGHLGLDDVLTRDGLESLGAELDELTAVSRAASVPRYASAKEGITSAP
jgi:hypothetical protein